MKRLSLLLSFSAFIALFAFVPQHSHAAVLSAKVTGLSENAHIKASSDDDSKSSLRKARKKFRTKRKAKKVWY